MMETILSFHTLFCTKVEAYVDLITDRRCSNFNHDPTIGQISFEAIVGCLIALLQDGDMIEIDIPAPCLNAEPFQSKFNQRRTELRLIKLWIRTDFLGLYVQNDLPPENSVAVLNWRPFLINRSLV